MRDLQERRNRCKTGGELEIIAKNQPSRGWFDWFRVGFIDKIEKLKIVHWGLGPGLA